MTKEVLEVIAAFKKSHDDLIVTSVIDYDNKSYVIEAVPDLEKTYYNDPYWTVDKNTHEIKEFNPSVDIEKFMEAVNRHLVYSYRG